MANKLSMLMEDDYYKFTSDIQLVDASRMAMSKDGNGLCKWFEKVGEKFGKWLHTAEYFVKHFWTKIPDEIIKVGEDMKVNDCKTLSDYIDKSMKASTKKQISQIVDLEVDIPKTRKKISSQIDWWD